MTNGTFTNTYLIGRRSSRLSPHRRSKTTPIGEGTGDPAQERGTYDAFRAFKLANHPPKPTPKPASHGGKMLK
jgi:hypothetical protein